MDLHEQFKRELEKRQSEDSIDSLVSSFSENLEGCEGDELHNWAVFLYSELLERGSAPQTFTVDLNGLLNDESKHELELKIRLLQNSVFWLTILAIILFFI